MLPANRLGLRLSERMAGWIQFQNEDVRRPFDFKIHAFASRFLQYPFKLEIQGNAHFPGFQHPQVIKDDHRTVTIRGTMEISLHGVSYELFSDGCAFGEWTFRGSKKYQFWPLSWKVLRHSLTWLPGILLQNGESIARAELKYPNPLWQFPLGLKLCQKQWAWNPWGKLASSLFQLARFLYPDHAQLGSQTVLLASLEEQLEATPSPVRLLLSVELLLVRFLSLAFFFTTLSRLNANQGERLVQRLGKSAALKFILLPLSTLVLYPLFSQKHFLKEKGQNMVAPPRVLEVEPWMKQCFPPVHHEPSEIEADCVIVGSGAGGAAFAWEMAGNGKSVVILEEGNYFKRPDLSGLSAEMMRKLYTGSGIQFSLSNAPIWIPTGKCVGGTTFINSGTCIRTPQVILDHWRKTLGLEIDLESYFPAVEEMMGGANPVPKEIQGGVRQILEKGLEGTPYTVKALQRAETGCDGQAACIMGCPTDAKRSTAVSFIPAALKRNAFLFSHMKALKILTENGKAIGIRAGVPGFGSDFEITVKAKIVVLAAGALGTPDLLHRSGLRHNNPHVGQHLTIHPALTMGGLFPEKVRESLFVPQSLGVFGIQEGGFVLEGYTLPVDVIPPAMAQWGQELVSLMNNVERFTNFSSILQDRSEGKLLFTPWGALPVYRVHAELVKRSMDSLRLLSNIFFQAGATTVYLPLLGIDPLHSVGDFSKVESKKISASQLILSAHHPLGTCRMAGTPARGAVSSEGEFFSMNHLLVVDGSAIPGPLGVNPQITIMANALRLARLWSSRI